MIVLVNALATTNPSGRHVVLGMLSQLARWTRDSHRFVVLCHAGNAGALVRDLGPNVVWRRAPSIARHWTGRWAWERVFLPSIVRHERADWLFSMSGAATPGCRTRQAAMAMNPWCLVTDVHRTPADRAKAALQRRAYRDAVRRCDAMVYLSAYLRDAYETNAGRPSRQALVVHAGIGGDIEQHWPEPLPLEARTPGSIVCVSVMAPHKGIDVLLRAVSALPDAHLTLAGPWPDGRYRTRMDDLIRRSNLTDRVTVTGFLDRAALLHLCARARVFSLLSRCESFGIPGIEAQALGTPVVSSDRGAMPEVYGDGGIFVDADDATGAARALARLLHDDRDWTRFSRAARLNASHFTFEQTSRPLLQLFSKEE